ncbi:MAG: NUDIX hydrolase, partial [bacterium]|nr:NUDIX hydrolase [bacterium]
MEEQRERRLIVAGLLRLNHGVLLVRQRGAGEAGDHWALPGGLAEPGEVLTEALKRELAEESGLSAEQYGQLVCVTQLVDVPRNRESVAFAIEVTEWTGKMEGHDVGGRVREVGFFQESDALERLDATRTVMMREPIQAFLKGQVSLGALWLYRDEGDGP